MISKNITLKKTEKDDLHILYQFQLDRQANYLAAFTSKEQNDEAAYIKKYSRFLTDPTITMRTIKADDRIVGSVAKFVIENDAGITYWIDREFWGQGIATTALQKLLEIVQVRPIYGHVSFDNYGSQRVLEKCGLVKIGQDKGFANARHAEIEEYNYKLVD